MPMDAILKLLFMGIELVFKKHANSEQVLKLYYDFVKQLSPYAKAAAKSSIAIEEKLLAKQKEIDAKNGVVK